MIYDHTNLQAAAALFLKELQRAIASGDYTPADIQHMKRVEGNVRKIIYGD